jgi:hypothetical protein
MTSVARSPAAKIVDNFLIINWRIVDLLFISKLEDNDAALPVSTPPFLAVSVFSAHPPPLWSLMFHLK